MSLAEDISIHALRKESDPYRVYRLVDAKQAVMDGLTW